MTGIPDKILTFQTITTLLEVLQDPSLNINVRNQPPLPMHPRLDSHGDHSLAALAILLVRNRELTAVTMKASTMLDTSMEIIVCSHEEDQNLRMSATGTNPANPPSFQVEIDHSGACDVDPRNPFLYIRQTWISQSFQSHASAVIRLLKLAEQDDGDKLGIFAYVAAKSYQAMLRTFQGPRHSEFVDSLLHMPTFQGSDIQHPFPLPQPTNSRLGQRDVAFIESLSRPVNDVFLRLSTIKIPNLLALAENYQTGSDLPLVYTQETCVEFHRLLCHLLRSYEASLLMLDEYGGRPLSDNEMDDFEFTVYGVATCALTLRDLLYSSYLDEHLRRIQPLLVQAQRNIQGRDGVMGDAKKHMGAGECMSDIPEDAIFPWMDSESLPVGDACLDWLKSQGIHFEAADNLIGVASHFDQAHISTTSVAVPYPAKAMRPWTQVVKEVVSSHPSTYTVQDAIGAIENVVSKSVKAEAQLKGDMCFRGTLHCDACLASIIHRSNSLEACSTDEVRSLDKFTKLNHSFGVSKLCCQLCSHLRSLLGIPEPSHFQLPGSCPMVTACTLPPWLPAHIIDSMLFYVSAELNSIIQNLFSDAQSKLQTSSENSHSMQSNSTTLPENSTLMSTFLSRIAKLYEGVARR